MTQIDPSYQVILTYSPGIHEITGHIFECFDYYLFLKDYYKAGILFMDSLKESFLKKAFEDKYIHTWDSIKNDVFMVPGDTLQTNKLINFGPKTVVILTDGNIISLQTNKIVLGTKRQLAFSCLGIDAVPHTVNKRMKLLQDYRIYSGHRYYQTANYVKKIPFEHYRRFKPAPEGTGLMYVTYNCRKVTRDIIIKHHKMSGCRSTTLVVPYAINEYNGIDGVQQVEAPVSNLFEKFETYIYTPVERKFDCSPRLVTECFLHGKRVHMDLNYVDIGLQTRHDDCLNRLDSLLLKPGDSILQHIEEAMEG